MTRKAQPEGLEDDWAVLRPRVTPRTVRNTAEVTVLDEGVDRECSFEGLRDEVALRLMQAGYGVLQQPTKP
jgi:hypothetical protein